MKTNLLKTKVTCIIFLLAFSFSLSAQDVVKTVVADCFIKRTGTLPEPQIPNLLFKNSGASGTNRRIYLRFDISDIDTTKIETAKLLIYLNKDFTNIPLINLKLYGVSDKYWDELTVVDPGPVYDITPFADLDVDGAIGWKQSTDLSAYLKKSFKDNKSLNFAIFSETYYTANTLQFDPKEKEGGNAAKLEIKNIVTALPNLSGKNDGIKVYQGQVRNLINIKINEDSNWQSLSVQNLNGQSLKKFNISGLTEHKIDMSGLSKGIYILKFTGNNKTTTRKIINL